MFYNIQGLRALAVISVILFHYQITYFEGGFLGVDIFFVISGYLMALILDNKVNYQDILKFYFRRIKRLLPALLTVILISLVLGFLLMSDITFERLGKSSLSSTFFLSNFFFWREWGYFDLYSLNKPLLHTWSLSMEMQFYFIFPIILFFLNFFLKKVKIIFKLIFLFILLSLFTELLIENNDKSTFYLLPFRISEFLMGSIGYFYEKNNRNFNFQSTNLFIVSFVILLFHIFYYDKSIRFPGLTTIIPCFASLLLILNKKNYLSKIIFQNKFSLFIGNISYSLFLVHWPLFVFYRFYKFQEPSDFEKISLIIVSIILAFFLNKYVENYFKNNLSIKNNYKLFFSFLIISVFCSSIILNNGYNFRIANNNVQKERITHKDDDVFNDFNQKEFFYKKCIINNDKKNLDFIFFGDSHAHMFRLAVLNFSKRYNKNFCFVDSLVSCNFFKEETKKSFKNRNCSKRQEKIIDYLSKENFPNLIISQAWITINQNELNKIRFRYKNFYDKTFKNNKKNIIFFLSVPEFSNGISMESCSRFPKYVIKKKDCISAPKNSLRIQKNHKINQKIQSEIKASLRGNSFFLNPYDFLCDKEKCKQVIDGYDVYIDQDHLSLYSSDLIIKFWEEKLIKYMK